MFDRYSDGYCPQCMLQEKKVAMILNWEDYWECPECRLQAHTASGGMFSLLRTRGKGDLKPEMKHTVATNLVCGCVLTKVDAANPYRGDKNSFKTSEELARFIKEEVVEPE